MNKSISASIFFIILIWCKASFGQVFDTLDMFAKPEFALVYEENNVDDIKWLDKNIDEAFEALNEVKGSVVDDEKNNLVSGNVRNVIKRELLLEDQIENKISSIKKKESKVENFERNSGLSLYCLENELSKKSEFDYIPSFDENEIISTNDSKLTYKSNERLIGSFLAKGCLPVNLNFKNEFKKTISIFTIGEDKLNSIKKRYSQNDKEKYDIGYLIVELEENFGRVSIDRPYEFLIYFDANFNELKTIKDAKFVLFGKVATGNVLINVQESSLESEFVTHVFENEITYEKLTLTEQENPKISIFKRDLLSTNPIEAEFPEEKISYFNKQSLTSIKISNSQYELRIPSIVSDKRKYFEIDYTDFGFIIGIDDAKIIELPSDDLLKLILENIDIRDMKNSCVVQINLNGPVKALKAKGYSSLGNESVTQFFLDSDGKITDEISELTEKIFLTGRHNGIIDFNILYTSGKNDSIRTFCVDNVYLVEQL